MPIVQNEPNSAGRLPPRRTKGAKRTQFVDCGLWIADCGLGTDLRRDAPRAPCRLLPAQANCAKRTQFCRSPRVPEGETYKTNPISGTAGRDGAAGAWDKRAKRSRFPATPGGAGPGDKGRNVQNEPNFSARPGGTGPRGRRRWRAIVQNEAKRR